MVRDIDAADVGEAAAQVVILVVEDSPTVRITAAHYFRYYGYTVLEASNADEAIYLMESGFSVDIVLSDVQMPGSMDGNGFADYLANEMPEVPVILTSGGVTANVPRSARSPRRFVHKPYDFDEVRNLIAELLDRPDSPSGA